MSLEEGLASPLGQGFPVSPCVSRLRFLSQDSMRLVSHQSCFEVAYSGGFCGWHPETFSAQFPVLETFLQDTGAILSVLSSMGAP